MNRSRNISLIARITLESGTGILPTAIGTFNNAGLLTGDGTVAKFINNNPTGEIRAAT